MRDSAPEETWVRIGTITAPHGLVGEARVTPDTDFPERFAELAMVQVRPRRGPVQLLRVRSARYRPDKHCVLLAFEGIADRDAIGELCGATIWIPPDELWPVAEGQYYEFQIIGLNVRTTSGEALGPVTGIIRTGANDVYVTERGLIPAISDVVKVVDLERGEIVIEPVPGLLD